MLLGKTWAPHVIWQAKEKGESGPRNRRAPGAPEEELGLHTPWVSGAAGKLHAKDGPLRDSQGAAGLSWGFSGPGES